MPSCVFEIVEMCLPCRAHVIEWSQHNLGVLSNYDRMQASLNWLMYKQHSYCFSITWCIDSVRQGINSNLLLWSIPISTSTPTLLGLRQESPLPRNLTDLSHSGTSLFWNLSLALIYFRHLMEHGATL